MSAAALPAPRSTSSRSSSTSSSWNGRSRRATRTCAGARRRADGERQRERPDAAVARCRADRSACGDVVVRRVLDQARAVGVVEHEPSAVGVEGLDRAAEHDVEQRVEVELGGERVAHPAHRRLQAAAFAADQLELELGAARSGRCGHGRSAQQPGERQHQQHGADVSVVASAASRPIGARQASTTHASAITRICSRGRDAERRRLAQHARLARSTTQAAANASSSTGALRDARGAGPKPASTSTSAGPSACQESETENRIRSGCARRRSHPPRGGQRTGRRRPAAVPRRAGAAAASAPGPAATGPRTPAPTGNLIRETIA